MFPQLLSDIVLAIDGTIATTVGVCPECSILQTGFWTFSTWIWIRLGVQWLVPILLGVLQLISIQWRRQFHRFHYFGLLPLDIIGIVVMIQDLESCHWRSSLPNYALMTILLDVAFSGSAFVHIWMNRPKMGRDPELVQ